MRLAPRTLFAAAAFSILPWTNSATAADAPLPLFASDDVLRLTLKGPIDRMSRTDQQRINREPVLGLLTVEGDAQESLPVELSVRGLTRSRREICPFPPLRVEFPEDPPETSLFKGQGWLKLVTHCRPQERFQQHILLEYAAYRLYNAMTPESFEVRLAQIDYVSDDGSPITSRLGFLIEDIDDTARRNGQRRLRDVNSISDSQLDPMAAARVALFQNMIGNLDWAVTGGPLGEDCCHNSRLIGTRGEAIDFAPVPYDFDFSGLVNAPYAAPPATIRGGRRIFMVRNVRVRLYRGYCQHNEQAQAIAADMLAGRASLLATLDETPLLEEGTRQQAAAYLGEFFDDIDSPQEVAQLLEDCR